MNQKSPLDYSRLGVLYMKGISTGILAKRYNRSPALIQRNLRKVGIQLRSPSECHKYEIRARRIHLDGQGYLVIRDPKDPDASRKHKYVYIHRRVMAKKLGRPLTKIEVVHHEDENKLNNEPSNLRLFKNKKAHITYHCQKRRDHGRTLES